jgi:hypothetical protein
MKFWTSLGLQRDKRDPGFYYCILRTVGIYLLIFTVHLTTVSGADFRWVGHVARMGEKRNAYRILVGKSEVKGTLRRPRRRSEDNIKMEFREIG